MHTIYWARWRKDEGLLLQLSAEATPAEEQKPKGPPEPPEFHFSAQMPNISAQDIEFVRLTALFVVKNGRHFITQL